MTKLKLKNKFKKSLSITTREYEKETLNEQLPRLSDGLPLEETSDVEVNETEALQKPSVLQE